MFEIEIKAWLHNRRLAEENLETFANYIGKTEKIDTYWMGHSPNSPTDTIKIRIRRETGKQDTVTYKQKEIRTNFEVNDEKECTISDSVPLEAFLTDIGFFPSLTKHKSTKTWLFDDTTFGTITIEISDVENLGDFIELEILSTSNIPEITKAASEKLMELLARCGIDEKDIETRYYSELLQEKKKSS